MKYIKKYIIHLKDSQILITQSDSKENAIKKLNVSPEDIINVTSKEIYD